MGLFHCPIGAAYYDDDACIDCGLCNATTSEEKVESSRKIREYIRSHAARETLVSKIAVCGKGGAGKSTVTTLLAQAFVEAGYMVTVLDSDDSNPCLCRMLGMESEPGPLGDLMSEQAQPGDDREVEQSGSDGLYTDDIPAEYMVKKGGINFMLTGKIYDPFQGCSCSLAESARRIVEKLKLREKEVLILDTEAGVESFGRGVERGVDTVLAVVEPSYGSIELAVRIKEMAQGMGISRVGAVLNKMGPGDMVASIKQRLAEKDMKVLGAVNHSLLLAEASLEGRPLLLQSDAGIYETLTGIAGSLVSSQLPGGTG